MKDRFRRLSLWVSVCQFVGTCLISYGFRIKAVSGLLMFGQKPIVLDGEAIWALYVGWALVVLGFLLQVISELRFSK